MTTPESAPALTTIARGTTIRGSIRGDGDLDLHGYVEGTVTLGGELQIGETALVKSDVSAKRVIVRGAVLGNLSATELIVLEPGSRVVGDVGAPQIGIRPGALVRGNVATGGPLKPRPSQVAAPAQAQRGRPGAAAPAAAPSRPAVHAPLARPGAATAARPAPAAPAARPVAAAPVARPAPVRPPPAPVAPPPAPVEEEEAVVEESAAPVVDEAFEASAVEEGSGPPPPVVPAVPKGAKAQVRRGRGAAK